MSNNTGYSPLDTAINTRQPSQVQTNTVMKSDKNQVYVSSGMGTLNTAMTNFHRGFNHRMVATPTAKNREISYLPFFTRPDLNLSQLNMSVSRRMQDMADAAINSDSYAIMSMLDPLNRFAARDSYQEPLLGGPLKKGIPFDNRQAFMPIFSNACISISGIPENTIDVYTSEEGLRREQISFVDSTWEINNAFTINCTFKNLDRDPITRSISTWLEYMAGVFCGDMMPRSRAIYQNEIDYQTRLYLMNVDPTCRYVTRISSVIAMFPMNDNIASMMNVDMSNRFLTSNDTINIQFQCNMCEHNDPILYQEFNAVVAMFNPDMADSPDQTGTYWIPAGADRLRKIPYEHLLACNWTGYPHINVESKELEWYVYEEDYNRILNEVYL